MNGEKYHVGYLKADSSDVQKTENKLTKSEFSIDVNWPVSADAIWIPTSGDFRNTTGITRYSLFLVHPGTDVYSLWFTNNRSI